MSASLWRKHETVLYLIFGGAAATGTACHLPYRLPSGTDSSPDPNGGNPNGENPSGQNPNGENPVDVKTGKVTFFNESSYPVIVHQVAFSGPVLLELAEGQTKRVDVRASDNHGAGSTFSVEYLYRITDAFDAESGSVLASGIDPNVQITFVVEADKTYTKQIPQPSGLEFRGAFIKILNVSDLPFEFCCLGTVFKQAGSGNIPAAPGKSGVYKLEGISGDGKLFQNYLLRSTFAETVIPDFAAKNGFIYTFTYSGDSAVKTGEQAITFHQ